MHEVTIKPLEMRSTRDTQALFKKAACILMKDSKTIQNWELEMSKQLMTLGKHVCQMYAVQLKTAELRGLNDKQLKKIPHFESED